MEDTQTIVYAALATFVAVYIIRWGTNPLNRIPTVGGPSAPLLSYISAYNFIHNAKGIISEGYQKYHGSVFKVAMLDQWMVIVSGSKMVDDLRKRPDDEVSFIEGAEESLNSRYTIGRTWIDDPYHVDIIRERLMRTLPVVLPDVLDELTLAVPDHIPVNGDEWVTVRAFRTMQKIVARASNRVFVGVPACRNGEYLDLAIKYTIAISSDRERLKMFPWFFKGIIGAWTSDARMILQKSVPHLKPIIQERLAKMEEFGDSWTDKPNDMVQWIIEEAIPRNSSLESIVERILLVNFAAIHTSSNSVTHAVYHLAAAPEYFQPLRDEIEPIVKAEGWTKAAMGKMWKLDSFLRESQRYNGIGMLSLNRKVFKDITLPDGTFIPAGTLISAASYATHRDDAIYAGADAFDGFRFARMRAGEGESMKHQFVNTSPDYIPFGHGRHACPGRFFAANELKALVAFLVVNYDFKVADGGMRPRNVYFAEHVVPDPGAKLLFRKRQIVKA